MKLSERIYWKGIEQLKNEPEFIQNAEKEFPQDLKMKDAYGDNTEEEDDDVTKSSRRDFLKVMGFSVAAVSLTACEAPVRHTIPYLTAPEEIIPTVPNYYASTYVEGGEASPVVIKTREGRPIFVDGNAFSPLSKGKVNARISASVLGLYDSEKEKHPLKDKEKADWKTIDTEISSKISSLGSNLRLVSQTVVSPTTQKLINEFCAKTGAKHVSYDPVSVSGMMEANYRSFGRKVVPSYNFDKAELIVSINADFLGFWLSQVEHSVQYAKTRKISEKKQTMSRHYQIESVYSNTGALADYRLPISPSQEGAIVAALYKAIGGNAGGSFKFENAVLDKNYQQLIKDLKAANGKALVVSGSNDPDVQQLVNAINQKLGSYGSTIDMQNPSHQRKGDDKQMNDFVKDLQGGAGVIFYNCNPVYDHPKGNDIAAALPKAKLSVSTSDRVDATANFCTYLTPDRHYLESWNDAEPKAGHLSLIQPTINPIFDTRQFQDSLMAWSGMEGDYYTYLRKTWQNKGLSMKGMSFDNFWKKVLHDGVYTEKGNSSSSLAAIVTETPTTDSLATSDVETPIVATEDESVVSSSTGLAYTDADWSSVIANINKNYKTTVPTEGSEVELVVYAAPVMGTGSMANNPWIQETPDPITKLTWGHAVLVSMLKAKELGFETVEIKTSQAKVTVDGTPYLLPVIIQPGMPSNTIAISLGYGHQENDDSNKNNNLGKVSVEAGGANAYKMLHVRDGFIQYARTNGVTIESAGETEKIARTQTHQTYLGRETIIQEAILKDYQDVDKLIAKKYTPKITMDGKKVDPNDISIWDINSDGYGSESDEITKYDKKETAKPGTEDNWLIRQRDDDEYAADTFEYNLHHWGMVIDLNTCTGCSACLVACSIENNVPIVGKTEVENRREMHWMRIDRYYTSSIKLAHGASPAASDYAKLKDVSENPEVVFQPMMCQHCNNAPCETVCPVAATTHSSEGLNQMTYNRCVGTKYCANNCPYKVRRFNWFKYHNNQEFDYNMNSALGKMVLNPDVTVRSRGVMEKCSLCVQRIQEGKLAAKRESRKVRDGEVVTACASACPTNAITFGDLNDKNSEIVKVLEPELAKRAYNVLQEINTRPNVWYLTKVRNQEEEFVPSSGSATQSADKTTEAAHS
ncbi:Fe-S-cluster-containing hydrogenase subunit [Bernardetia litoralis DSM 6794]|uniref:Fe-S-cluster-containing hydrogenase subunit n=1 Tax=Bernardetia litoralis (strain ATCC 23117 / DSM 6794 / NBRC 15988 / NCIMB 1366 / Fx l1 / Sio-4) TaxID=880071 RepID=I4ALN5_BERLS|nr:TAT-variant-translocated molybdopterin oxidoreductase [Bernardetia litoralis]AFM04870.1 Fe-S-cluster-containing hydrogenase subunit [Bernardetia litoralis DSM 6794]